MQIIIQLKMKKRYIYIIERYKSPIKSIFIKNKNKKKGQVIDFQNLPHFS